MWALLVEMIQQVTALLLAMVGLIRYLRHRLGVQTSQGEEDPATIG